MYDLYVSTTNPHLQWTQERKIKNQILLEVAEHPQI